MHDYSPEELARYCGSPEQLARISSCELADGKEKGVRCLNFHTGSGLNFTVVPDRAMDIAFADYKGHNLCFLAPGTVAAPSFYEPSGWNWKRTFFGGLLTTCGLVNVGAADSYEGEEFGAHGRISSTPARHVSYDSMWAAGEYYLVARGEMNESSMPHYNISLRRSIQARAGRKSLRLHDTVTNHGFERFPHQILYHMNIGFPILDRTSYLVTASRTVTPRDQVSDEAKEHHRSSHEPTPGYAEKLYYHELIPCSDGRVWAAVINPDLGNGLGVYVKYPKQTLPVLWQWKMMGEGTYVMGIEPSNSYGIGIERQRALGTLKYIQPGEHIEYYLEIGVLDGRNEIAAFEEEIARVSPPRPEYASILI